MSLSRPQCVRLLHVAPALKHEAKQEEGKQSLHTTSRRSYLRVDSLEFGLESRVTSGNRRAVGAAAWFGHVVVVVLELGDALAAPAVNILAGDPGSRLLCS